MTKVKLINGTIINAGTVTLDNGILAITTTEGTVEKLAEIFSNKENTALLTFMTESEKESGFRKGFTSFAGIDYDADGNKTVRLFQPADVTESRISNAEGTANQAITAASAVEERVATIEEGQEVQDGAIVELAEIIGGE